MYICDRRSKDKKVIIFSLFENDSTVRAMSRLSTPKDVQVTGPVTLVKSRLVIRSYWSN